MRPGDLQADCPGICTPQREWICTWGWVWRWEAEGRGDQATADGQGRARPGSLSERVLIPPLPCMHLKVCFLETMTGSRWGWAFGWWALFFLCPLGSPGSRERRGHCRWLRRSCGQHRHRWGPQSQAGSASPWAAGHSGQPLPRIHAAGIAEQVSSCRGGQGGLPDGEAQRAGKVACDPRPWPLLPPSQDHL